MTEASQVLGQQPMVARPGGFVPVDAGDGTFFLSRVPEEVAPLSAYVDDRPLQDRSFLESYPLAEEMAYPAFSQLPDVAPQHYPPPVLTQYARPNDFVQERVAESMAPLNPIHLGAHSGEAMSQGIRDFASGDNVSGATNVGIATLGMLPAVGPAARFAGRVASRHPRVTGGAAAAPVLGSPTIAGDTDFDQKMLDLRTEQSTESARVRNLEREYSDLVSTRDDEGKSGKGPRWRDADKAVKSWERANRASLDGARARVEALQGQIDRLVNTESPEAQRKLSAETPIAELYPDETLMAQMALAGGGLAMSALNKGRSLHAYNKAASQAEQQAANAAASAQRLRGQGNAADAAVKLKEAQRLTDDLANLKPNNAMTVAPAIGGLELAAVGPTGVDYLRSGGDPDNPLYEKAIDSVTSGKFFPTSDVLSRLALAGAMGLAGSKVANAGVQGVLGKYQASTAPAAKVGALMDEVGGPQNVSADAVADAAVAGGIASERAISARGALQDSLESGLRRQQDASQLHALRSERAQAELDALQGLPPAERAQALRVLEEKSSPLAALPPREDPRLLSGPSQNPSGTPHTPQLRPGSYDTPPAKPPQPVPDTHLGRPEGYSDAHAKVARKTLDSIMTRTARSGAPPAGDVAKEIAEAFKKKGLQEVSRAELVKLVRGSFAHAKKAAKGLGPKRKMQVTNPSIRELVLDAITGKPGTLAVTGAVGAGSIAGDAEASVPDDFDEKIFQALIENPEATDENVIPLAGMVLGKLPKKLTPAEQSAAQEAFSLFRQFQPQ
jgi:hypothetical protein